MTASGLDLVKNCYGAPSSFYLKVRVVHSPTNACDKRFVFQRNTDGFYPFPNLESRNEYVSKNREVDFDSIANHKPRFFDGFSCNGGGEEASSASQPWEFGREA